MNLYGIRKAVIEQLAQVYAPIVVKGHGGRFDFDDLKNYGIGAPEIRIGVLSARRVEVGRTPYADIQFAAYVIAGSSLSNPENPVDASERGLQIGSYLVTWLSLNTPGQQGKAPEAIAWQNLFSNDTRDVGKHLSAVTWRQMVALDDDGTNPAALADFLTFVGTYDLAPADGRHEAADTVALPPPEAP